MIKMPIVGFNINKIDAVKEGPLKQGMKIENNVGIKDIKEEKLTLPNNTKESVVKIGYTFSANYNPDIGHVKFNGEIIYAGAEDEIKKILGDWKKDKKIGSELMTLFMNFIMLRCNIKAFIYAQDVELPPHLKLPSVRVKDKENKNYIG